MRAGQLLIDALRGPAYINPERDEMTLLADAVEEADGSFRDLIESECLWCENEGATVEGDGWWDTHVSHDGAGGEVQMKPTGLLAQALSYLDRRGLLIRKEGEPHMVRFVDAA